MDSDQKNALLSKMELQLADWEMQRDSRLIFLSCYQMMTTNVLRGIEEKTFEDNFWVSQLMEDFAGVYFTALDQYNQQLKCPLVWEEAFRLVPLGSADPIQNLLLGVNAHINFDLVFVVAALLKEEWSSLSAELQQLRYRDHCRINNIIHQTIDEVQDVVIERFSPKFDIIDRLFGQLDEWMTARLIAEWRDEVWDAAVAMIESHDTSNQQDLSGLIETRALQKMKLIIALTGGR